MTTINTDTSYDDESDDESSNEDYHLAFISRKIRNMWKKRNESDQKGSKKPYRKRKDKDKSSLIRYECKKLGHFKLECQNLDKTDNKKRYFKPKDKKVLMSSWEELDDTSSNEETKKKRRQPLSNGKHYIGRIRLRIE